MKKGGITVYLALTLTVLTVFLITAIEAVRVNTIRFQIECAFDAGLYSALAEYNRELLKQYDLFFVDTSYGGKVGSTAKTGGRIREYMEYNLQPDKNIILPGYRDFWNLSIKEIMVFNPSIASDENFAVLKQQAVEYMKDKTGIDILEEVAENFKLFHKYDLQNDRSEEREKAQKKVESYNHKKIKVGENKWKEIVIDNPADAVNKQRGKGVLQTVTQEAQGISGAFVTLPDYASYRDLEEGAGLAWDLDYADGIEDEILFGEYILLKTGCYTRQLEKSQLKYQTEYILQGKGSDLENLRSIVNKLLLIRETANYIYLMADSAKREEAKAIAGGIAAVLLVPDLQKPIQQTILFAWAYAESVNDVKILLEGGKIPLVKRKDEWRMSLSDMLHYKNCLDSGKAGTRGLSYQDYLRILLLMENKEQKAARLADIIEMDIRSTEGNSYFCIDACISGMETEAVILSGYGYEYTIKRRYGYELLR